MIPVEKIEYIWDEFYKEESADNQVIKSSGLGLAITKNILILHNAKYGCTSVNENTKFWFTI
jgi:signal transduction histidine kinase